MTDIAIARGRRMPTLDRHHLAHGWIIGVIESETPARPTPTLARSGAPAGWRRPRFTADCACPDYCERDHGNE